MDYTHPSYEQQQPILPSESMEMEFQLWNEKYCLDALTELTSSQIEATKRRFEGRVHRLVAEHNPGRLIKNNPLLLHTVEKPAYTPQQWNQAQKMIQREAEKIYLRFDRAAGIVIEEEQKSRQNWYAKLADAITPESLKVVFQI